MNVCIATFFAAMLALSLYCAGTWPALILLEWLPVIFYFIVLSINLEPNESAFIYTAGKLKLYYGRRSFWKLCVCAAPLFGSFLVCLSVYRA